MVDTDENCLKSAFGSEARKVLFSEVGGISGLLKEHQVLVTCTGKDNFLSGTPWAGEMRASGIKLINMSAADEFGPAFSEAEVENGKRPINFKLKKPTLLKYLDPVFYAHNSVVALCHDKKLRAGLQALPKELDDRLIREWHSIWGADIAEFLSICPE